MKKIKSCLICLKFVGKSFIYKAEVEKIIKNPITGKFEKQILMGFVCPICNKKAGYKTNSSKLEKFKGGDKK